MIKRRKEISMKGLNREIIKALTEYYKDTFPEHDEITIRNVLEKAGLEKAQFIIIDGEINPEYVSVAVRNEQITEENPGMARLIPIKQLLMEATHPEPKFKPGDFVIHQNGDRFELGEIKSIQGFNEGTQSWHYFIWYHKGETAANTSESNLHAITNGYAFKTKRLSLEDVSKPEVMDEVLLDLLMKELEKKSEEMDNAESERSVPKDYVSGWQDAINEITDECERLRKEGSYDK